MGQSKLEGEIEGSGDRNRARNEFQIDCRFGCDKVAKIEVWSEGKV